MAKLEAIEIAKVCDHPRNPRIVLRQDVIDGIAAQIEPNGYQQQYAIHVRKIDSGYQVLSGHHRKQAAIKAGCDTIWCWVEEDMSDEDAFMLLVTANSQGELDPLEIGIHAFEAVPNNRGKKGGGLQEYAEKIGRAKSTLTDLKNAGEVACKMSSAERTHFLGKAKHLAAIHKLPKDCWQEAAKWVLDSGLSAKDVAEKVAIANEGSTAKRKMGLLLGKTSIAELQRIDALIEKVAQSLIIEMEVANAG